MEVEGPELQFVVDRESQGVRQWIHLEADNFVEFVGKVGIARALGAVRAVRLKDMGFPDSMYQADQNADQAGHSPNYPVRGLVRRRGASLRDDALLAPIAVSALPGLRVLSCRSPSMPSSASRRCRRLRVGRLAPARGAPYRAGFHSAENWTICARQICLSR